RCGRECSKRRECKSRDKSDRLAAPRYHDLTRNVVPRRRDNSRRKYGEKFPRQDRLKKTAADLFVHARELLVEANRLEATTVHQRRPSGFLSLTPSPPSRISPGSRNTTPAFSNAR